MLPAKYFLDHHGTLFDRAVGAEVVDYVALQRDAGRPKTKDEHDPPTAMAGGCRQAG